MTTRRSVPSPDVDVGDIVAVIVAVIVTHRGRGAMLRRCLESVDAAGGVAGVIVVDNSDQPTDTPRGYGPGVTDVVRTPNHGFGAAANRGIEHARSTTAGGASPWIALLNDDIVVTAGWLTPLRAAMQTSHDVGAVQPKLLVAGTRPAVVNSVGVRLDDSGAGVDVGIGEPDGPAWGEAMEIEMFTGGAVLLRDEFLGELSGFDERFFLYYEDVDLALRGAARGWRFLCEPSSVVLHEGSVTTSGLGDDVRRLQDRNRLWIAFRFGSFGGVRRALWLSVRRLRHPPRIAHARGLLEGLLAVPRLLFARARDR